LEGTKNDIVHKLLISSDPLISSVKELNTKKRNKIIQVSKMSLKKMIMMMRTTMMMMMMM